jgi:hypothetical protein
MANVELYPSQINAIERMHNGCVLVGGVGSGKSRTALAYVFLKELQGQLTINQNGNYQDPKVKKDVYIITTAKKRDSLEWELELIPFGWLADHVKIDSWNNIQKYQKQYGCIFIFDEQRAVGRGKWAKAFVKIAKRNHWILLTATPGDTWNDLIPLFLANGYFKNRTDFNMQHVIFNPYMNYPVIDRYVNEGRLLKYRKEMVVLLDRQVSIEKKKFKIICNYNKEQYKHIFKDRWNPYDDEPIRETGKLCYLLRRSINEDPTRLDELKKILVEHPKIIIFYNFSTELHLLQETLSKWNIPYSGWNGETHDELPTGSKWCYLCQYIAAAEGWNCITTDTIVFFSLNYSYKTMTQAAGRIDRSNSPFKMLYYYYFTSYAPIDLAINKALTLKRNFNEKNFLKNI